MKINIFKIDSEAYPDFLRKIQSLNMNMLFNVEKEEWVSGFYISKDGEPTEILWKKDYIHLIPNIVDIKNYNYYALNIFKKNDNIFVISYGKAHFYIKPFCDTEFGLNIVKRIGDVDELKMKQSKRFAGKKKKEIRSYKIDSSLEMESGESVDYLGLGILKDFQIYFGKSGKFGNSAMLSIENLKVDDIHKVLEEIVNVLRMEEKFTLPKLEIIKDKDEIMRLNNILIRNNDILNTENTDFELIGVNFIFEPLRKYKIKYKKNESSELTDISVENINNFIRDHNIPQSDILKLEIIIINDDGQSYKNNLYSMIEYYIDEEFTMLENGKWKKFNQDYIKWINDSVDKIEIEKTEEEFKEIIITEPDFNKTGINIALSLYNYTSADTVLREVAFTRETQDRRMWSS